ncbi:MAG: undecaprenyl-diphosphatase [Nitrospiraceae bacterium]|jgi:undecaprenyl-diphosphatase|nr:MAG: undecaprenyl-diphosphatase [Nitrospiraceae bacterium]
MNQWGPELAVILGLVEGLTEFLPVSSTGHLILVGHALGFTGAIAASVDVSIQLGSILAVVAYERRKIVQLFSQAGKEQAILREMLKARGGWATLRRSADAHRNLWFLLGLGVAFLPAALVGFLAHRWIETYLFTPQTVAASLIVGGLVILAVEARRSPAQITRLEHVGVRSAFWVGVAQCVSLIPGMSRSGSTIVGGLLAGLDRKVATEYSFFLALPTMIAATAYKMITSQSLFSNQDYLALGLGLVVSFVVAWAVIAAFLTFVQRHSLRVFAYYRLLLGTAVFMAFR